MLGATHACANPLTAGYGTTYGVAIAALLAHVVRWNWAAAEPLYRDLAGADLADQLADMAVAAGLPSRLRDLGVPQESLAGEAATQWTGRFNPRPVSPSATLEIYQSAY
jgi:alcohol dehydrogenase